MGEPRPAEEAVAAVRALADARPTWTVLVDGRSGAGKSTLAAVLASVAGAEVVRLDDLYPGWDGLGAGSEQVRRDVLAPRAAGRDGSWRRWDWERSAPAEAHRVPAEGGLVCEGAGVLTRRSALLADLTIWVELDAATRKERALLRDGDAYAPHWARWAEQERAFIAEEDPVASADLVVDGRSLPQPAFSERTGDAH